MVFLCCVLFSLPGNAQVGNILRKGVSAVSQGATRALEKTINKEIEKAAEKRMLEAIERSRIASGDTAGDGAGYFAGTGGRAGLLSMGFGEVTLKYDDSYSFNERVVLEMETFDNGKSDGKVLYTILINSNNLNSAIELKNAGPGNDDGNSLFLFDLVNKCFMILSDEGGKMSGMIAPITDEPVADQKAEDTPVDLSEDYMGIYKRTGRSRTIAGYKCDEYLAVNTEDQTEASLWITKDVKLKTSSRGIATAGLPAWYYGTNLSGHYVMEMETREKGSITYTMITREINDKVNVKINMKGCELVQLNMKQ